MFPDKEKDFVININETEIALVKEIRQGISSKDLADQIPGAIYCATLPEVTQTMARLASEGDVMLTIGAGDIFRAGEALLVE